MPHPVAHVRTARQAADARRAVEQAPSAALDCEAAGFHRYSDRLCLVQLSTPTETFVLDPIAVELAPHLKPVLEDPARPVLMHGAAYDLRLLRRDLGVRVGRIVDTQIAASLAGEPAVGLQALLERHLGVRVSKKFQRADWARRPLSGEMIAYAAGDTRHLHRLAAALDDRLRRLGRLRWAEEEYGLLLDAAAAGPAQAAAAPDPVIRIKAARRMDPRSVTLLRELVRWRDRIARSADRAPFRVASDAALLGVVSERPATVRALAAVKGFPARLASRRGSSLLALQDRVARLREAELSPYPPPPPRGPRPDPEEEAAFERLKRVRNAAAVRLGLDRGRVMPNHVARRVAAAKPRSRADLLAVDEVRRWQAEVIGDELLAALPS